MALLTSKRLALCLVLCVAAVGCSPAHRVEGIVERVDDEYEQVVLAHDGLEGVLPAGSTAFSAPPSVRQGLAPGQVVVVEWPTGDGPPALSSAKVLRLATEAEGWIESAGTYVRAERAEPIALRDTTGQPVSLADLAGQVVMVDFIYTSCPGPCPMQTQNMVRVQRSLSEAARDRVRLISVTIDPETDDGPTLAAYAERHGVDPSGWSFLTGPVGEVEETYARYGIGISDADDGSMDHTLRSFVIDDRGYLVDRYRSDFFDPDVVVARLEALAAAAAARSGG